MGAHMAQRKEIAHAIADKIKGNEDAIALFTNEDAAGEHMWLMKPKGKAWKVQEDEFICTKSGEKFEKGERVIKGEYYEKLRKEDLYEIKAGIFTVPASMIRGGGEECPLAMHVHDPRAHVARGSGRVARYFRLDPNSEANVTQNITNVFK